MYHSNHSASLSSHWCSKQPHHSFISHRENKILDCFRPAPCTSCFLPQGSFDATAQEDPWEPIGTHTCTVQKYKGINLCPRTHLWLMRNGNQEINAFRFDFLDREFWDTSNSYGTRTMVLLTASTPIIILVLFSLPFHSSCPSFLIPWDISWINHLMLGSLWSHLMLFFQGS